MTIPPTPYPESRARQHEWLVAPVLAWGLLGILAAFAALDALVLRPREHWSAPVLNIAMLAIGAAALLIGVRRIRGRTRIADAFFPLVLLNPWLYMYRGATPPGDLDKTLLATGILGLTTGIIIAMRRDNLVRYFVVGALGLSLIALANSFLMLLPPLAVWFIVTGYQLSKSAVSKERVRGFIIMALGEVLLLFFGIGCILEQPEPTPAASTLFSRIVSFADFPLIVISIVMLALGWRKGPNDATPPHFWGMLALLVGLLTLLLNNFQYGTLPPPGADQTTLLLCLLYTVSALHGPRRLQWIIPPVLLALAVVYTTMR
jgi:hypothetical protein